MRPPFSTNFAACGEQERRYRKRSIAYSRKRSPNGRPVFLARDLRREVVEGERRQQTEDRSANPLRDEDQVRLTQGLGVAELVEAAR
jgi:hypothetical protein